MRTHRPEAGFSLAALIFFATAASIFIAAAVPAYQMQAKRQMELELIFRGEEYSRAIQKYQRKFGVYPTSIDQLVSTNGLRFLRRAYQDPITGKEFRLITIDPNGSVNGSKLFGQGINTQPLFGNTQTFGNTGATGNTAAPGNTNRAPGTPGNAAGNSPINATTGFGANSPSGFGGNPAAGRAGATANAGGNTGLSTGANQTGSSATNRPGNTAAGAAGNQPFASGGVIGVASDSDKESIMVYNTRQKYDEWEFIAILGQTGANGANPAGTNPAGTNPGANPFGTNPTGTNQRGFNPTNPTPSSSPFGGPAGSPLGPGGRGATPPIQQPFGFGNPPGQQPRK